MLVSGTPTILVGGDGVTPITPHQITLREVTTQTDRDVMRGIIEQYHSYKPTATVVGRQINWLILSNEECVGAIGLGSPLVTLPKCLYSFIRPEIEHGGHALRAFNMNSIAVNWRFTLKGHQPNVGSKALALLVKVGSRRWYEKYGDELALIYSLVERPRSGAVYKAAGWQLLGVTKPSGRLHSIPYGKAKFDIDANKLTIAEGKIKLVFAKPMREDWRELARKSLNSRLDNS